MTCDQCRKRRGMVTTSGGYILCKPCAKRIDNTMTTKKGTTQ